MSKLRQSDEPKAAGRRRRWAARALTVALLAATFGVGWAAAVAFQSPEQREAAARPPAPAALFEPVVAGQLKDEVQVRALVSPANQRALRPASLPSPAVVTAAPLATGATVDAGDVVLELSGRPVIVLPGEFPFYRDLAPGLSGPDVAQLQQALGDVGHHIDSDETGFFGASTSEAVRRLYTSIDYDVPKDPSCDGQAPAEDGQAAEADEPDGDAEADDGDDSGEQGCARDRPMIPLTEIVVTKGLPIRLNSTPQVGATLDEGANVATWTSGGLVAKTNVPPQAASRLARGMDVLLVRDDGASVPATVKSVGESDPATGEQQPDDADSGPEVVITPKKKFGSGWSGQDVLARITIEVVSERALLVPSIAITRDPQGEAFVSVQHKNGNHKRVAVEVLGELAGQTAVRPKARGALTSEHQVLVG